MEDDKLNGDNYGVSDDEKNMPVRDDQTVFHLFDPLLLMYFSTVNGTLSLAGCVDSVINARARCA